MDTKSSSPYVLRAEEGEAIWFSGNLVTIKATGAHTRGRVTVVEFLNPPGFAPPLHRHLLEDEMFHVLSGTAEFRCDGQSLTAGPGDFVFLPVTLPHTFLVGPEEPLHLLQITTPSGFEDFAAAAGTPASQRRIPDPTPIDPVAMGGAAEQHSIEILGPPPQR